MLVRLLRVLLLKFDLIQLQISGLVSENRDLRHGKTGHGWQDKLNNAFRT